MSLIKASQKDVYEYAKLVNRHVPKRPWVRNSVFAFFVGGSITGIGQVVLGTLLRHRVAETQAVAFASAIMIGLGAALTALGYYDELGRLGGMGAALPITGFANSIVSPAMEFKREGYVLGVAARMFQVAGPVIVYGLVTAAVMTFVRLIWR